LFTNSPADVEKLSSNMLNNGHETSFQVSFSRDSDLLSPRSMSNLREWFIVLIVSTTSFCVASYELHLRSHIGPNDGKIPSQRDRSCSWIESFCCGLGIKLNGLGTAERILWPETRLCFFPLSSCYLGHIVH